MQNNADEAYDQVDTLFGRPFFSHFSLESPRAEDVDFIEVAHVLAHTCCYGGRVRRFYSVAEHCVRVATLMPQYYVYGLLYRAHEAYMGAASPPIANVLKGEEPRSVRIEAAIYRAAKLTPLQNHPAAASLVNWAYISMEASEMRELAEEPLEVWRRDKNDLYPLPRHIDPWSPDLAKRRWLSSLWDGLGMTNMPERAWRYLVGLPKTEEDNAKEWPKIRPSLRRALKEAGLHPSPGQYE